MEYNKKVSKREYIVINAYLKKPERSKINILTLYPKELKKEEQMKLEVRRRKEIKITAEIKEIGTKKAVEKIIEVKSWFFENIKSTKL